MGATLPSGQVACVPDEVREIIYCVIGCDCVPVYLVLCMAVDLVVCVALYLVCVCVFLCACIYVFLCVYVCPCGYHLRAGGRTIFTRAKESGGTTSTWRIS